MPTFLRTSKMHPDLAERIAANVRGRKKRPGRRVGPRLIAVARFTGVMFLFTAAILFFTVRKRHHEELESARAALLTAVNEKSAPLSKDDLETVSRVNDWLLHLAGPYEGDLIAPELTKEGALDATVARSIVYVRGPIGTMLNGQTIAMSATVSYKDPLVACLVGPPKERTEKAMLTKVRGAYARDALFEKSVPNVTRLADAEAGLPFLTPEWAAKVTAAEELPELTRLRRDLEKAPTEAATRAAKSDLLFAAMDEEGEKKATTELDGERPHKIRLTLIDLRAKKPLLRLQKSVDPTWISEAQRPGYASGLDSCALSLDLRKTLRP